MRNLSKITSAFKYNLFICFIILLLIVNLIFSSSCSVEVTNDDKISIVCTAFSQYDFVKEIIGENKENFDLVYLFENGTDVHSFETTIVTESKIKILSSDIFIYNGGESDKWATDIIKDKSMNADCTILSLMSCVAPDSLIPVSHSEHNHEGHTHDEECYSDFDEHVWLSLKNAKSICKKICAAIVSLDSENKSTYENNLKAYISDLDSLNDRFIDSISSISEPFLLVADRFPFIYLLSDYNISYSAAFSGCTAETNATIENVLRLSEDVKNHNLESIIILENSNTDISDAIITNSGIDLKVLKMNSLQSVSKKDIDNGMSFYSAMESNFKTIEEALK